MQGRFWVDYRLVLIAAIAAIAGPGQAVAADIGVVSRSLFAGLGLLAWWYLYRCLSETWALRFIRRDGSEPSLIPWLVFTGSFYTNGLLLGLAWRECRVGEAGTNMVHVLVSATLVGFAGVAVWGALRALSDGRRALLTVLTAFAFSLTLLWPAMVVWHLLAGSSGSACAPDNIPGWWPSWLPIG